MAPPKTMAISQQQQQQQSMTQADQQTGKQAKPRKRKAKQQQQQPQQPPQQQQPATQARTALADQQASTKPSLKPNSNGQDKIALIKEVAIEPTLKNVVVPSERFTVKKQQNQVPTKVKEPQIEIKRPVPIVAEVSPAAVITKHHQLTNEEADDVDAGIELDGSSNSGSSVKDINEDQLKSTSVSPIMAQSSLIVNETCAGNVKQPVEVTPVEQLTSSLCSAAAAPTKKISTTKQQLAANQQVIDADEQLLQEKLQNKQRKSSITQDPNSSSASEQQLGDKKSLDSRSNSDKSAKVRRSFSSQSSQEEGSLCKVCEQHVYQMERMLAEKSVYHKRCFRCYQCKIQLRVDNYSSHEGEVYCKAHHRQIFQPQVKLDSEEDVDIVAKSTSQRVDDYLLHRGRLSELSFSFLQQNPEGIRKRQMIICENEPTELPKDVVRSDTKLDDGIQQLNLNLNNILEKFERGTASNGEESQPNSAGVLIDKPSINIKQTLMAFESKFVNPSGDEPNDSAKNDRSAERPVVKKLANLNGFFKTSIQENNSSPTPVRPLAIRRSESLMMRLKKYESRVAGEQVDDENSDEDENNNSNKEEDLKPEVSRSGAVANAVASVENSSRDKQAPKPRKLPSIDLSSLKNQWETGDINKKRDDEDEEEQTPKSAGDKTFNGNSPSVEKNEELLRIRQQLAEKKSGESGSIRNIYENAIKEAQLQSKQQASRRDSSDLSALNGFSTTGIQQQLLQNSLNGNSSNNGQNVKTPTTPNKDHFQLNLSNKANKLKEKFELGLITNSSQDDSDLSEGDDVPALTKLEQIRQEKMDDLSVFTEGEIKAREARNIFQQMDRRISAAAGSRQPKVHSRSLAAIGDSMRTKLTNQMNANSVATNHNHQNQPQDQQPIRLTNNVRI